MNNRRRSGSWVFKLILLLCLCLHGLPAAAQESVGQPSATPPVEDRYIFRPLPDISVTPVGGTHVSLSELGRSKPLIVTLVFTRCSGICSPFLQSLAAATRAVGGAGSDYRVLVLSFDPRDSLADMSAAAEGLGLASNPAWIFGVSAPQEIRRLAEAMGFWFKWDPASTQYDHPSVLVGIDHGRIVRMLAGGTVSPVRFREVADELRGKFVPAYPSQDRKVAFRCFRYEPGGGVHVSWGFFLMLMPGALTIVATLCIFSRTQPRHSIDTQAL